MTLGFLSGVYTSNSFNDLNFYLCQILSLFEAKYMDSGSELKISHCSRIQTPNHPSNYGSGVLLKIWKFIKGPTCSGNITVDFSPNSFDTRSPQRWWNYAAVSVGGFQANCSYP